MALSFRSRLAASHALPAAWMSRACFAATAAESASTAFTSFPECVIWACRAVSWVLAATTAACSFWTCARLCACPAPVNIRMAVEARLPAGASTSTTSPLPLPLVDAPPFRFLGMGRSLGPLVFLAVRRSWSWLLLGLPMKQ